MKYRIPVVFLLIILLSEWGPALAASERTSYLRKIQWKYDSRSKPDDDSVSFLLPTFYGATYADTSVYPLYTELIRIPEGKKVVSVTLSNCSFQALSMEMQGLPDTLLPGYRVMFRQKTKYLHVSFPAVMKSPETNTVRLLTRFILEINYAPVQKSSKTISSWVSSSVLAEGKWVKIRTAKSGIHKITYDELQSWGLEDPSQPRIFGNGGRMVPEYNSSAQPDDLKEIPIRLFSGSDGIFNSGDYMLFYAEGPVTWRYDTTSGMFVHAKHLYDDSTYYYLTSGPVHEIEITGSPSGTPDYITSEYDDYRYHEQESENLIKSGREWYEPIPIGTTNNFYFDVQDRDETVPVRFRTRVAGRSANGMNFQISVGNADAGNITIPGVSLGSYTSDYARAVLSDFTLLAGDQNLNIGIDVSTSDPANSKAWLDYIDVNFRRKLQYSGTPFTFRDIQSTTGGILTEYRIETQTQDLHVWDITDIHNVQEVTLMYNGGTASFKAVADTLKEYIVFSGDNFPGVEVSKMNVPNQNLHAAGKADMLIVTYPAFLEQAEALAQLHRDLDQLRILVATTDQIYNEFSSGSRDAGAIRNFVRMFYTRAVSPEDMPKYLLLFGDGSYDNRSGHPGNTNFIPTWQSQNSLSPTRSFVSDDFYGLMDADEGGSFGLVDIGIGRLPVKTAEEAEIILSKIRQYTSPEARGSWRNMVCFIGDDEDSNIHMRDANTLAGYVENNYPSFNIDKIYLDAYKQVTTSSGDRYPEVNLAINKRVQDGSLIVNYVGHGNERGLAHERILGIEDINEWKNTPRLPLFVTATCEFSRFDDVDREITGEISPKPSAGEWVLLNPDGGGIALLTTTRLVYSSPNFVLNQNFYKYIFATNSSGRRNTLGDALRFTKNISGSGINKRNFTLLGDPALTLAYPEYYVVTDSINHQPVSLSTDTLKALSLVNISGHITDNTGTTITSSEGFVNPVIFDKSREIKTLANDGGSPMNFWVQDNILFNGKASITNGHFNFTFLVPKDINYLPGYGKLGYYAEIDSTDAFGSYQDIIIGGYNQSTGSDTTGPEIHLFINDTLFIHGGITGPDLTLLAKVSDPSGINTTGNGIGHDLIAVLDGDESNPVLLNNSFEYDLNSYQSGTVSYAFFNVEPGNHTLWLKAWDNLNNSSTAEIPFVVDAGSKGIIRNIMNYPNPFTDNTQITFEHNLAGKEFNVEIRIFRFDGSLVRVLRSHFYSTGFRIPPVYWDGKDENGQKAGAGIYVFNIILRYDNDARSTGNGKMIIIK